MLSKLIVNAYKALIEIALWATLFIAIIGGWRIAENLLGALVGAVIWLVSSTLFFGAFLVLIDIRDRIKAIQTATPQPAVQPEHSA